MKTWKSHRIGRTVCVLLAGLVVLGVGVLLLYSIRTYHVRVGWQRHWHLGTEPAVWGGPGSLDSELGMHESLERGTLFTLGYIYMFVPEHRTSFTR
jgi:hypothetical protein